MSDDTGDDTGEQVLRLMIASGELHAMLSDWLERQRERNFTRASVAAVLLTQAIECARSAGVTEEQFIAGAKKAWREFGHG